MGHYHSSLAVFTSTSGGERKRKGGPGQATPKWVVEEAVAGDSDSMAAQLLY